MSSVKGNSLWDVLQQSVNGPQSGIDNDKKTNVWSKEKGAEWWSAQMVDGPYQVTSINILSYKNYRHHHHNRNSPKEPQIESMSIFVGD